jgi:two-component system CheB/CheR fusion protein
MAKKSTKASRQDHRDPPDRQADNEAYPFVVGVGASAGGFEAFSSLLEHLPPEPGFAIVFVVHLDPKRESLMGSLLSKKTSLPVHTVNEPTDIRVNHVYLIPPGQELYLEANTLKLKKRTDGHKPIDTFLLSLASSRGSRAVGVLLSGNDHDGLLGLQAIKGEGGITFAQDDTAQFRGMPHNAIATGFVDFVMNPAAIAAQLVDVARHPMVRNEVQLEEISLTQATDEDMQTIFQTLRRATGVDFSLYKPSTVRRRIVRRMVLHKIETFKTYARYMQDNLNEVNALYEDLLINVTSFFRDAESFEALNRIVFPELLKHREPQEPVRIWVPGCSSGEQVYSIAISLLDSMDDRQQCPIQIFGTDISENAIARARAGRYPAAIASDVSPDRLRRYFTRGQDGYTINRHIRDMCVFARQNLVQDPPFSRLDLICCSNVLIYLGPTLQRRVTPIFHYALKDHGFLVLGGSETIGAFSELFSLVDKRHKIYTKKPSLSRVPIDMPAVPATAPLPPAWQPAFTAGTDFDLRREVDRLVMNRYAPPGVVVNDDFDVMQFRGRTGAFFEPAPGPATMNVLKMAREGLMADLRDALQRCKQTGLSVRKEKVRVRTNDHYTLISLEVAALRGPLPSDRYYLVTLEPMPEPAVPDDPAETEKQKRSRSGKELARIRQELAETREDLQAIIEEKEAANEELKAANEEIQSANEELQSTNEELQMAKEELLSTNEELTTINEELHNRNVELSDVNNDLLNLLSSIHLPIIMLSRTLRIRRFTPTAEKLFNIIPSDVGRPLSDIKSKIQVPDLDKLVRGVIDSLGTHERVVQDEEGRRYSMRIRPYQTAENRIDGAVITLVENSDGRAETD